MTISNIDMTISMSRTITNDKYWWYSKLNNCILHLSGPSALSHSLMSNGDKLTQIHQSQIEVFKLLYDAKVIKDAHR